MTSQLSKWEQQAEALETLYQDMKGHPSAFDQQDLSRVVFTLAEVQIQIDDLKKTWSPRTCKQHLLTTQVKRVLQHRSTILDQASVLPDFPNLLDYFVNKQVQLLALSHHAESITPETAPES